MADLGGELRRELAARRLPALINEKPETSAHCYPTADSPSYIACFEGEASLDQLIRGASKVAAGETTEPVVLIAGPSAAEAALLGLDVDATHAAHLSTRRIFAERAVTKS